VLYSVDFSFDPHAKQCATVGTRQCWNQGPVIFCVVDNCHTGCECHCHRPPCSHEWTIVLN